METNVFLQLSSGDGLPSQVCQHCAQQVNTSYDFKLRCENTDAVLRQYLSKMQPNHKAGIQVCMFSVTVFDIALFSDDILVWQHYFYHQKRISGTLIQN
jgi:hypothetical protein